MKAKEKTALKEYTRRLREHYRERINRVVLFGSQARDDACDDSDIDILIVVEGGERHLKNGITDLAFDMMLEYDVDIEPAIFSRHEWDRMSAAPTSFAYTVEHEGREL